uniref:pentapeptide repeat-containing protein n=1 Tax=Caballeronia sordidicola TaxID=196367 RepID=UPI0004D010EE
ILYCANLQGANLRGANLTGVDLKGTNLVGTNLEGANLSGVQLSGARYNDLTTRWPEGFRPPESNEITPVETDLDQPSSHTAVDLG